MNFDLDAIARQLPERRWFGGKGRTIGRVEVLDDCVVDDGPPALLLALVEVHYAAGEPELYQLPLLRDEDGTRDATEDPQRLGLFGELMAHGVSIKGSKGIFTFGGPGLDPLDPPGKSVRVVEAEQTNTSLVLDESFILKLFRRVDIGPNPDLELTRALTTEGFEHVPSQVGEITYEAETDDGMIEVDLGIAQSFARDAVEGWEEILRRLGDLFAQAHPEDAREDYALLIEERWDLTTIEELGDATAALHVALAREEMEPALAPEPIEPSDLAAWCDSALAALQREERESPEKLRPLVPAIAEQIERLRSITDPGWKMRIHSDYHLGQVLTTPRGWLIIDFEGEPARSLEERRSKHSPLRDVAGMLRSFNYAAVAARLKAEGEQDTGSVEAWSMAWEQLARERFLQAYLRKSHEGRFLPHDRDELMSMLAVFELDKALYELGYERRHRPEWKHIPLQGIRHLVTQEQRS
ncbi:MAG: hypothetical protein ABR505_12070 [Actinomycetota bacterium]